MTQSNKRIPFSDPAVRDLHWVIASPGLCRNYGALTQVFSDAEGSLLTDRHISELYELDRSPAPLHRFIDEKRVSGRLGNLFEAYLYYWLREIIRVPRLHASLQIRRDKFTLGELDFVFADPFTGISTHWEVAVKYYMCIAKDEPARKKTSRYVGQSLQDRLDIKLERITDHQLLLPYTEAAESTLHPLGLANPQSRLILRGRLFYPVQSEWRQATAPDVVSSNHARGWWTAFDAREMVLPASHSGKWLILPKERWLSSAIPNTEPPTLSTGELIQTLDVHFQTRTDALQIAEMREVENEGWFEHSRGIVLPPLWPHRPELLEFLP